MTWNYPLLDDINLYVSGRISPDDAARQTLTAREILARLADQPGLILADEVGMGKTFVALAAAVSVAWRSRQPVVVMVPPTLREKWPRDFGMFREKCLPPRLAERITFGRAERAEEFLKLLDDPPERRRSIIFVTHGALGRGLTDEWIMLALIAQSIRGTWGVAEVRSRLARWLGQLLYMKWVDRHGSRVWIDLLATDPGDWLRVLHRHGIGPDKEKNPDKDDDPVPEAVCEILPTLDLANLRAALDDLPKRSSDNLNRRLAQARQQLKLIMREAWNKSCISSMKIRVPLLVLDEAHHLKNARTQLARLFNSPDASSDADEIAGPLGGVFDRMLFLTATPFQLGHHELCSVLDRFKGVRWKGHSAPSCGREGYGQRIDCLRAKLDAAQMAAVRLDAVWGKLSADDLVADGRDYSDAGSWWPTALAASDLTPCGRDVLDAYRQTDRHMREAEELLRPWVIRHLRSRDLKLNDGGSIRRRVVLPGEAIVHDTVNGCETGLRVERASLLPFLLAARATACAPNARPVFAEGLASSYEAFLHTRQNNAGDDLTDGDDDQAVTAPVDGAGWYLERLEDLLMRHGASAPHPKIAATVKRVMDLWLAGEKVVVFCHYIRTGQALRNEISSAISNFVRSEAAKRLGCAKREVDAEMELFGKRFFDVDSPIRLACDHEIEAILDDQHYTPLAAYRDDLINIVRRYVRTPTFLVRFFPAMRDRITPEAVQKAFCRPDASGMTLRSLLEYFFNFLVHRCGEREREAFIGTMQQIQTGGHLGRDSAADDEDEASREMIVPNVRLVNGSTKQETRQRLMLAFNTPFYPDVLITSSVMAEGVDLHLNCRHIIHHDLCWNPSTLEQRTGRIDRIGAKIEHCHQPLRVYLPYIAETQDEKMYRVVMDRERWFSVVMGEKYQVDARTTERLARRIPFPESAARALAFSLDADRDPKSES